MCRSATRWAQGLHDFAWRWVRGHAGDSMNECADALATEARERAAMG
ncbi:MAG: hypothetical protein INF84_01920 [Roseomonas sp.]|nr:hypothetical protein [Roseomonas sp.]